MSLKVVSVFGASGEQGLGVVKSLLNDYKVNALTRSPEKLKGLSHPNLTVVKINIDDSSTLVDAFEGSWAVFANTWTDYFQPEGVQITVGKRVVDAAVEAGVEWFVYSSAAEGVPAQAWREKSAVMQYARAISKKTGLKTIFPQVGGYMSNILNLRPQLNPTGGVVEFKYAGIDEKTYLTFISHDTDVGPVVRTILAHPDQWLDAEIPVVSEALTPPEVAAKYAKVHGVPARHVIVETLPMFEAVPKLKEMFTSFKTTGFYGPRYVGRERELAANSRKLYPGMKTLEQWFNEAGRLDNTKPSWG